MADGGLLEFIKTPEGQGLLSTVFGGLAGARPGQPLNSLGRAGMAGMMGYGQAQDRQQQMAEAAQMKRARELQMAHQTMQIDEAKQEIAKKAQIKALQQQYAIPAKPESAGGLTQSVTSALPAEFQTGVQVSPMAAQPASFNREGFGKALEAIDPVGGLTYQQAIQKDNTPITVAPGASLLDKHTLKPIFTAPKEHELDPKIKQFEYAQRNGYKGSFEQFVTLGPTIMAAAAAPLREAQIGNINAENSYNLPPPRPAPAPRSGGASVSLPDGRVLSFPDQKAANSFKMKAGIK